MSLTQTNYGLFLTNHLRPCIIRHLGSLDTHTYDYLSLIINSELNFKNTSNYCLLCLIRIMIQIKRCFQHSLQNPHYIVMFKNK